jgi:hypothetical protein
MVHPSAPDIFTKIPIDAEIGEIFRRTGNYSSAYESYSEVRAICQHALQADPYRIYKLPERFASVIATAPPASGHIEMAVSRYIALGILQQENSHFFQASAAFDQAHKLDPGFDVSMARKMIRVP